MLDYGDNLQKGVTVTDHTHTAAADKAAFTKAGVAAFVLFFVILIGWGLYTHHDKATHEPSPRELANMTAEP